MEMNFKSIIGAIAIVGALNVNAAVEPSAVAEKLSSAAKVELIAESIEIIRAASEEDRLGLESDLGSQTPTSFLT